MPNQYQIADLNDHLVKEIIELESKMKTELGREITLIAYSAADSPENADHDSALDEPSECRAGLDD